MLTRILHNSTELCTFVAQLDLGLSAPQLRHVTNVADGLLVTDAPKTLAEIRRQFVDYIDPSNIADTFRIAPWTAAEIREPVAKLLMQTALERLERRSQRRRLLTKMDDSLAIKDPDTRHLQGVDWHYYHDHRRKKRNRLQNGLAYLACNIVAGDWNSTLTVRPNLRERTVRRINRPLKRNSDLHPGANCGFDIDRRSTKIARHIELVTHRPALSLLLVNHDYGPLTVRWITVTICIAIVSTVGITSARF